MSRRPLPGQADELPFADPLRDLHVQRALAHRESPFGVHFRHPQRHRPRGAAEGVVEVDEDPGVMVLAAGVKPRPTPRPGGAPEERGEKIAEVPGEASPAGSRGTRSPRPSRARVKSLAGCHPRKPIVGGTFSGSSDLGGLLIPSCARASVLLTSG